jgi:nucleoside phosphorylase
MFDCLLVEDGAEKASEIEACMYSIDPSFKGRVHWEKDVVSAKRYLKANKVDLMILDVVLPLRTGDLPSAERGLSFLNELVNRVGMKAPRALVGITEREEIWTKAEDHFRFHLFGLVKYRIGDPTWQEQLETYIRFLIRSWGLDQAQESYSTDLAIITAMARPELLEVLNIPWSWRQEPNVEDNLIYYRGAFEKGGHVRSVVATAAPRMGLVASTALAMKVIARHRPKYLVLAGIAAGVKGRVSLGDVLIADQTWDWGSGKRTLVRGRPRFAPEPHALVPDNWAMVCIHNGLDDERFSEIVRRCGPLNDLISPKYHVGPIVSGSAVVADQGLVQQFVDKHRKLIGIEMEGYGVFGAVHYSGGSRPKALIVKGVSDYAGSDKDDSFHVYASKISAETIRYIFESIL